MQAILKKLKLTADANVVVLNAPAWFAAGLKSAGVVYATAVDGKAHYVQTFEVSFADATARVDKIAQALTVETMFWLCYPKGSSKNYNADINRTSAWALYGKHGYEPVSQVSLNDDWSAIRYRHISQIKKLTRKNAATAEGKKRIEDSK